MQQLNFPTYTFKTQKADSKLKIFDEIRRRYVALTPEEWVRQHIIKFLQIEKNYPTSLMAVETQVMVHGLKQRADIVIYNRQGSAEMIVECKAPSVPLSNDVFDQAARYNMNLNVKYLLLTNGINHYCASLNYSNNSYTFIKDIPDFKQL